MVAEAAARAATLDILPLSFWYRKKCFLEMAKTLIELGQRHPVSQSINVKDALPTAPTVRSTIISMAMKLRSDLNCLLYTSPSPRDQRGSRMPSSA